MTIISHLLGEILIGMNIISKGQLDDALREQEKLNKIRMTPARPELVSEDGSNDNHVPLLGNILIDKNYLTHEILAPVLNIQKEREQSLRSLERKKLAITLELGCLINSTVDFSEVLSLIMKYANLVTDSVASTLMLVDEETRELVFSVPTGPDADDLKDIRIPIGTGVAGWVAQNEKHLIVNDTKNDPRFFSGIDKMTGSETSCLLCVPMRSKTKLIGVLEVINKKDRTVFKEEDALLLNIFAHQAAIAIENASLFASVQKQLVKEKEMQKELAESERLKTIGIVAGGLAHDFNNILGIIMGNAELLLMEKDLKDDVIKRLSLVLDQSKRGINLTRNLNAFAKTEALKKEFFSINDKIDFVLDLLNKEIDGIELVKEYDSDLPDMNADPEMMEHLLVNLIINAVHAMSLVKKPKMILRTFRDLNYICIEIEDNGCGIPEGQRHKIFTPLFTLKGKQDIFGAYDEGIEGTGYGMANVKKYVTQHQGKISFVTQTGKYTCFTVRIPI